MNFSDDVITENYLFLCKLKQQHVVVTANEITESQIQLLFTHGILRPFAPGHLKMRSLATANWPIWNGLDAFPEPSYVLREVGDHVILRQKLHADNK